MTTTQTQFPRRTAVLTDELAELVQEMDILEQLYQIASADNRAAIKRTLARLDAAVKLKHAALDF